MEEEEGNPLGITIDTIAISKVCGHVTSSHPPPLRSSVALLQKRDRKIGMLGGTSQVQLNCPPGKKISNILFASLGNTTGDCGGYAAGSCHLYTTKAIVERVSTYSLSLETFLFQNHYFLGLVSRMSKMSEK